MRALYTTVYMMYRFPDFYLLKNSKNVLVRSWFKGVLWTCLINEAAPDMHSAVCRKEERFSKPFGKWWQNSLGIQAPLPGFFSRDLFKPSNQSHKENLRIRSKVDKWKKEKKCGILLVPVSKLSDKICICWT